MTVTHAKLGLMMAAALAAGACAVQANVVSPQIGGGEVGMMGAPMKHADITLVGTDLHVHLDDTVATPWLRPLTPPNTFIDPGNPHPWDMLEGKAYNFQYAWNPGGFITLPSGSGIWIERLSSTPGLEVYLRTPMYDSGIHGPNWPSILQNDGDRWQWSGAMQHNAYAVLEPVLSSYSASYRVYLGDELTGEPLDGYGSADVTWTWNATPVPEPAWLAGLVGCLALMRRKS